MMSSLFHEQESYRPWQYLYFDHGAATTKVPVACVYPATRFLSDAEHPGRRSLSTPGSRASGSTGYAYSATARPAPSVGMTSSSLAAHMIFNLVPTMSRYRQIQGWRWPGRRSGTEWTGWSQTLQRPHYPSLYPQGF